MIRTAARFIALAIGFVLTFPHPFGRRANPARQPPESRYEKEWWEIDSLAAEGLPRPALRKVDALQARARREQNAPGQINDFASTLSWIKMPASIRKKRAFRGMIISVH
jgi:hypothetical protein